MLKAQGTAVGIQLVHGGRKACRRRPWTGYQGVGEQDALNGEGPWPIVASSPVALSSKHQTPRELDRSGIERVREAFRGATRRALKAGFDVVELHAAHGFLVHGFMSPVTNQRNDEYGGDFEQRHRLAYEVVSDMREVWPADRPFFVRVSLEDGAEGGRPFTETIRCAAQLKQLGVDVIDCSSGGIGGHSSATAQGGDLRYAPHVSQTATLGEQAGVSTMAVGLITQADTANKIIADGRSDLVGIGRQALLDPNWPLHSRAYLERGTAESSFSHWPEPYGWWLERHASMIQKIEGQAER